MLGYQIAKSAALEHVAGVEQKRVGGLRASRSDQRGGAAETDDGAGLVGEIVIAP